MRIEFLMKIGVLKHETTEEQKMTEKESQRKRERKKQKFR